MNSFRPKDGSGEPPTDGRNGERNFRQEKRSNETHASTTDPDAQLYRKGNGQESRLCYMGHVLMENRNGLVVAATVTQATGTAEREAALALINEHKSGERRITLGADKAYDVEDFVKALRERKVTPHIAIDGHVTKTGKRRKTAIDGRTLRHIGYDISQRCRKRVEEIFGWTKTTGGVAQVMVRGLAKVQANFTFAVLAYNLIRIPKLLGASA
jgi:IS5 family transposase